MPVRSGSAGRIGETISHDAAGRPGPDEGSRAGAMRSTAPLRGAVGAMAMTGMRVLTTELGLVEQTPPQAVSRQRARGARALLRRAPRKQRRGLLEAAHWAFGATGGAAFGALPGAVRRRLWAGPATGSSCGWALNWGSRPCWASARPSACAWSTAWRSPPTTCSKAWCSGRAGACATRFPPRGGHRRPYARPAIAGEAILPGQAHGSPFSRRIIGRRGPATMMSARRRERRQSSRVQGHSEPGRDQLGPYPSDTARQRRTLAVDIIETSPKPSPPDTVSASSPSRASRCVTTFDYEQTSSTWPGPGAEARRLVRRSTSSTTIGVYNGRVAPRRSRNADSGGSSDAASRPTSRRRRSRSRAAPLSADPLRGFAAQHEGARSATPVRLVRWSAPLPHSSSLTRPMRATSGRLRRRRRDAPSGRCAGASIPAQCLHASATERAQRTRRSPRSPSA